MRVCVALLIVASAAPVSSFLQGQHSLNSQHRLSSSPSALFAAKKGKKKKKSSGGGGGLKGFGSSAAIAAPSSSKGGKPAATVDKSKLSRDFYSFLEQVGAGDNLKRVALAHFPLDDSGENTLRGVIALRDIRKGEAIIDIPYEAAINLGRESSDPTRPATELLHDYTLYKYSASANDDGESKTRKRNLGPYFEMLPEYLGADCLGSTDFFSEDALDALQYPPIKEETLSRRKMTLERYQNAVEPMIASSVYKWDDGNPVSELHLRWAAWLITSRVLTVQGEEGSGLAFRMMIPLIDMCNHSRFSPHVLTGRAAPGGRLKILAGKKVDAGEQINIAYGGGVAGNDRFIQDYGFLDTFDDGTAFDMVAKKIGGGGSASEFGFGGRSATLSPSERTAVLEALGTTTIPDDELLLTTTEKADVRAAISYRLGVKRAMKKLDNE